MSVLKIRDGQFISVVDSTPLVSIDLVIYNPQGEVLLGRRLNRPAKGYWFVPGGRIRKEERIAEAFIRICKTELGTPLAFDQATLLNAFDHLYDDNFSGLDAVTTHYVVLGYRVDLDGPISFQLDEQHDVFKWWRVDDLLQDSMVHENTKNYFQ